MCGIIERHEVELIEEGIALVVVRDLVNLSGIYQGRRDQRSQTHKKLNGVELHCHLNDVEEGQERLKEWKGDSERVEILIDERQRRKQEEGRKWLAYREARQRK